MRTVMLDYWVIFAGNVLQIYKILWDAADDLTSKEALGHQLASERLIFLGLVVVSMGPVLMFRLGLRRRC